MNAERTRLWNLFQDHSQRGMQPGTVYITAPIMTSGHSMNLVRFSDDCARVVREIDAKLDDAAFVSDIYQQSGKTRPKNPRLKWIMNGMNLGVLDANQNAFIFKYGPGT